MEIRKAKEKNVMVIEPRGRVDTTSAHEFEQAVVSELKEGSRRFLIDFGSVEYISSAGLRILLMLAKKLGGEDEGLVLCSMNAHVKEVFDIAGFTSVFSIVTSRAEAMKRLTISSGTPDRVNQGLALLGAKPTAAVARPLSPVASLGYELLTGKSVRPAAAAPAATTASTAAASAVKEAAPTKPDSGTASKKKAGWLGRLAKR